ncbi:MAG: recombinase family protein [Nibricoccus sp.]
MSTITKGLRFAALIRVSTERQEEKGESLRAQRLTITEIVERLGGSIAHWYGGQEHATPGAWERQQVDQLVADAQRKPALFDAVIVTHADRWSRENARHINGIDVFRNNGIRFFVGSSEYNLFDHVQKFHLSMSVLIGEFLAGQQVKRSLESRILRAQRKLPTCGKLPFGRKINAATGEWMVDVEKQKIIEDVAKRYLRGERLPNLAREYRMNHSNLHKILTKRSGTEWQIEFTSERDQIHEIVKIEIPRLLPEKTIQAIKAKAEANRTFTHGQILHQYLFGHVIFCDHCGYAIFGQTDRSGRQCYRHAHSPRDRVCTGPKSKPAVPAREIEDVVMRHLFDCFGNPRAVQKAIEDATPNREHIKEMEAKRERLAKALDVIKDGRSRLVALIGKGKLSENDAAAELDKMRQEESNIQGELTRTEQELYGVPTAEGIRAVADTVARHINELRGYKSARITEKQRYANHAFETMTWKDKRALVEKVFGGKAADGTRLGVYIEWVPSEGPNQWRFRIAGHVAEMAGVLPMTESRKEALFGDSSTKSATYSRGRVLRGRRSRAGSLPPAG